MKTAAAICALALAGLAVVWAAGSQAPWLPECPLHKWTGLLCFGCGGTRAAQALLHGDWAASLRCNALLLPFAAWLLALCLIRRTSVFNATLYTGLAVLAAFMLLRNIPLPCFDCIRPGMGWQ